MNDLKKLADGCRVKADLYAKASNPEIPASFTWIADEIDRILGAAQRQPELTAEFTKALPGGKLDDSTFSQIEDALDSIDAPMVDGERYLTLIERIAALGTRAQAAPDYRQELENARQEIVLAIAFLGRDIATKRLDITATQLCTRLANADARILGVLALPSTDCGEAINEAFLHDCHDPRRIC